MSADARDGGSRSTVVAMSGGVDSSLSAALMAESGDAVIGVTLRLSAESDAAIEDARVVARHLGVEHRVLDLRDLFSREVLGTCWREYAAGRTPNPCARCNPTIKFGALLDHARELGADALATGHHARLERGAEGPRLRRGQDAKKDQSYFLARLSREQLAFVRFPIGHLTKDEVRREAAARGIPSAERPESQDTCVAVDPDLGREGAFAETLRRRFDAPASPGDIVAPDGRILGRHDGLHRFTIGQRRGLGVSLGRRAWVVALDGAANRVVVSTDPEDLLATEVRVRELRWHGAAPRLPMSCLVQVRSRSAPVRAVARRLDGETLFVDLLDAVAAVTPGQVAVLYEHDIVRASGWIEGASRSSSS